MMLTRQSFRILAALFLTLCCHDALADLATADGAISNLYENLLQREYAGPVVFPNHQVERKAQRSPSLRLRFGRRSDPDLLPSAEKRWFGDVNQKPIRSPSLRLRFGRRSDPTMPLHSSFDALMNDLAAEGNAEMDQDYADAFEGYERAVRKPQRLRWGRSVRYAGGNDAENFDVTQQQQQQQQQQRQDVQRQRAADLLNSMMNSEKWKNVLSLMLQRVDEAAGSAEAENALNDDDSDEFSREARKPAPLRLRWGRSTGGRGSTANAGVENAETEVKKTTSQNALDTQQTQSHQATSKD